uniref:NADH-ubiquinone oxidoreductase chain 2 n=1 Tax=Malaxella flava TaxID=871443 RepID=A0A7S4Z1D5_9HEMI|nr:NADH dehydrogenase subunit 2 [Malaxella flava]QBZ38121.1 NADH dehydrogenase subunit 2 [Malaxella flava]
MKMNFSNMMSLISIITSTTLSLMTNNWLFMWILMEINLFMFIPLMSKNKINDQSIKFFIIQSLSSHLLIFSIMMMSILTNPSKSSSLVLIALLIKIGMTPFHIWMPEIMSKMSWNECFLMNSPIKITPMILINKMSSLKMLILPMILSLISSSLTGLNQINLKKLMAFSSIFNLSWMISSFFISKKISFTFMFIYSMLNFKIMKTFKKLNLMYMNQINYLKFNQKTKLNLILLSISGFPPLMGFFPKWMILKEMIMKSNLISSIMILTSMVSMFMYLQINSFSFTNSSFKKKNLKTNKLISFKLINLMMIPIIIMSWMN